MDENVLKNKLKFLLASNKSKNYHYYLILKKRL